MNNVKFVGQIPQAVRDILAERHRHTSVEGYTPEHDDDLDDGSLAQAAGCYALASMGYYTNAAGEIEDPESDWPWGPECWKPGTPRRMLEKAGSLIVAEMERLDRAAGVASATTQQPQAVRADSALPSDAFEVNQNLDAFLRLAEMVESDANAIRGRYPVEAERAEQLAAFMRTSCAWARKAQAAAQQDEREAGVSFEEWLCSEMPAGTVIGDPKWWAPRILRAAQQVQADATAIGYIDYKGPRNHPRAVLTRAFNADGKPWADGTSIYAVAQVQADAGAVYQVWYVDNGGSWCDVQKAKWDAHPPQSRRVMYRVPQPIDERARATGETE